MQMLAFRIHKWGWGGGEGVLYLPTVDSNHAMLEEETSFYLLPRPKNT
jgi:hypothetical protein